MDRTREIRERINLESDIDFGKEKFITHGMLPEDLEKEYFNYEGQSLGLIGDVGAGKILPIKNKKNFSIKGGDFTNPKYAFTNENRTTRRHHNVDELTFLDLDNCEDFTIDLVKYTGPHFDVREVTGYPAFYSSREFAHGVDLRNCERGLFKNLKFSNVSGDMLYFRKGELRPNNYITLINCEIDFNGRQGAAWGDGQNIYIDNLTVKLSGRGGVDVEPPKHGYVAKNVIVKNSYFNTWLLPMPMGGQGTIENFLVENCQWTTSSPNTYLDADRVNSFRKNIIFRGNKRLSGYGTTDGGVITARGVEGLLIENEYAILKEGRSLVIAYLDYCTNVVIRSNDFPNAKYIVLKDTPIEEVKVYGNVQKDLEFKIYEFDMPFRDCPALKDFEAEGLRSSEVYQNWAKARSEWLDYNKERNSRSTIKFVPVIEYDVEKYGEPNVSKDPDFIPYMGVDTAIEETPEIVEPEQPIKEEPAKPLHKEPSFKDKVVTHLTDNYKFYIVGIILIIFLILVL